MSQQKRKAPDDTDSADNHTPCKLIIKSDVSNTALPRASENLPKRQTDLQQAPTSQKDLQKASTSQKDLQQASTSQKDSQQASTSQKDSQQASTSQKDSQKASTSQKDSQQVPTSEKDLQQDVPKLESDQIKHEENSLPVCENEEASEGNQSLREFHVLDEETYEQEDSGDQSEGSLDSDIPDEEIEAMLEEGLPEELKNRKRVRFALKPSDAVGSAYEEREKVVLEEMGHNHFDVLPEGWVQVTHNSGMPVFLHKPTRVCTLAQPYFLGPGSARKHEIPLSAITCLQYRRALEAESAKKEKQAESASSNPSGEGAPALPSASIETIQENKATQSLSPEQVREYCQKLFKFKSIKVLRFKSWSDRRRFTKQKKHQRLERPTLPEGTKLIKFPLPAQNPENGKGHQNIRGPNKEWIMNPNGKSYVCILHEYVQHALKKQPSYEFKELENAATPYAATVHINGMQYGVGFGTSKKQAKSEAAKDTLEILIPEMREKIREDKRFGARGTSKEQDSDLSFFDEIKIEDPRVAELCAKTTEPSPYAILLTCLQRNFGLGEMHINYEVNTLRHQKNEFTMSVGRHSAKVICKNKRDGKQRASQAILQSLHPHITSWGSLLRLYGSRSVKSIKEKKQEEQEITLLQSKASVNSPNFAILNKLKGEMTKLKGMRAAIQPIGKFIPPDDVKLPSSSGADLNNVDL